MSRKPAIKLDNVKKVIRIDYDISLTPKEEQIKKDALEAGYTIVPVRHRKSKSNGGKIQSKAYYEANLNEAQLKKFKEDIKVSYAHAAQEANKAIRETEKKTNTKK